MCTVCVRWFLNCSTSSILKHKAIFWRFLIRDSWFENANVLLLFRRYRAHMSGFSCDVFGILPAGESNANQPWSCFACAYRCDVDVVDLPLFHTRPRDCVLFVCLRVSDIFATCLGLWIYTKCIRESARVIADISKRTSNFWASFFREFSNSNIVYCSSNEPCDVCYRRNTMQTGLSARANLVSMLYDFNSTVSIDCCFYYLSSIVFKLFTKNHNPPFPAVHIWYTKVNPPIFSTPPHNTCHILHPLTACDDNRRYTFILHVEC